MLFGRKSLITRIFRSAARALFVTAVFLLPLLFFAGALWYRAPGMWHWAAPVVWVVFCVLALLRRRRKPDLILYLAILAVLAFWWVSIPAKADRDWMPEFAYQATGDVNGDHVTLHHVRDFRWKTETDYKPQWRTRHYNLAELERVDLFLSYWGMPAIAHTLVSFGFKNGEHVVFSVETRKEKGEVYSNTAGFFKEYELAVLAADERDIIYLRTNVRGEDVYRYKIDMPKDRMRDLFLSYVEEGRQLAVDPEFYNSAMSNCTTSIFKMLKKINPGLHMDIRVLLSGYLPGYLYKIGGIDNAQPLPVRIEQAAISRKAKAAGADYSAAIRR